ncbi:MAG TPA: efflux RND transporter periplasmic adaptor subunit [Bacteroidales bacterium]|nr:efflux RND transporter periplasmic adaptor subunit [Bacteroidales bacterium]HOK74043.1 efflux RND transporter periplasmic adaptor subunit [Bacteroidales bacterium]HOM40835.1 efflux RND transporter periplasmic adaptor subunit [Bacteroidales bacterium]HOU29714.1 efflux RND transporter periplasmic adaptor subunit [Bacteroidales bacterium]HPP92500.1 efflux RND transporter periplasmic adaptor subunit [Bacteroidales bacterium]
MKKEILFLLILQFLVLSCKSRQEQHIVADLNNVKVVSVASSQESLPVHAAGVIMPEEEIKLSFKTGGIVEHILVKEGDRVKKGTLLASLNLSEISSQAELARNAYEKALRDYTRVRNLYADSVATLEQLQNATTALNMAKSNLDIANFNLERSKIVAPADGIILKQLVRENELVAAGYPVFLFGLSGKMWKVTAGLADRDIIRVRQGDSAVVMPDAWPGVRLPGIVEKTGELAGPLTGTFDVEIRFSDGGYRLAAGFIAGVDIFPSVSKNTVYVPAGSVVDADGNTGYIFALTDSSTVKKIKVVITGIRGSEIAVENLPGDVTLVVSEGAAYLKDGMKVNVLN